MRAVAPVSTAPATAGVAPTRRPPRHRRASTTRGVPKASAVVSEDVSTPTGPSRRGVLAAPLVAAAASAPTGGSLFAPPRARAEETRVLVVSSSGAADAGSAKTFPSVTAALAALSARGDASPASIRLSPGVYAERVVVPASLAGDLLIEPVAGAAPGSVTLEHRTGSPYEATVENQMPASRGAVTLRSVNVRHASPSVANNYAAFATPGSSLTLESCDVQSDTGSGIAAEGATLVVKDCRVHDCKSHGVAVYGDLLGEFGSGEVSDCAVSRNGGDGVLLRQGAFGVVRGCVITDNGGFSVELVDCREGTTLVNNKWTGSKKRAAVRFGGYGEEDVVAENNVEV
jgi:hypothetical protein